MLSTYSDIRVEFCVGVTSSTKEFFSTNREELLVEHVDSVLNPILDFVEVCCPPSCLYLMHSDGKVMRSVGMID